MSEQVFAVMFADIAGSSAMYKTRGDASAKAAIFAAIDKMSKLIKDHQGVLVKLIGDEVLCYFASADYAVLAATNIQKAFLQPLETAPEKPLVSVRIGIHWGPAILDQDDIFGDAVNTAARMVAAAKEKQVVVSPETVNALNPVLKTRCRVFDLAKIKAFTEPVMLYIVSWEDGISSDATHVSGGIVTKQQRNLINTSISIHFQEDSLVISSASDHSFYMGREQETVDLWINTRCASRRHAWIEYRRGKFVLFDHSTNGTYIRFQNERELFLKREEMPLRGSGSISLGQHIADNAKHLVVFECQH